MDTQERKLKFFNDAGEDETNRTKLVFRLFRRLCAGLIILILVMLLIFNYDKLNIDDMRRALAKIDFSLNKSTGTKNQISYTPDKQNCYLKYKNGLAVVSADSIKVFDNTGYQFSSNQLLYSNPAARVSKDYILSYDMGGGNTLSISNSFSVIYTRSFENTISYASINDNGYLVAVTTVNGYKNLISVYSGSHKEIFKMYSANRYIASAVLLNDNKTLVTVSLNSEDTVLNSYITAYKITNDGDKAKTAEIELADQTAGFIECMGTNICVITDKSAVFADKDLKINNTVEFSDKKIYNYTVAGKRCALVLDAGDNPAGSYVIITDDKGKITAQGETDYVAVCASFLDSGLALLTYSDIRVVSVNSKENLKQTKQISIDDEFSQIIGSGKKIFLIAGSYTKIINI